MWGEHLLTLLQSATNWGKPIWRIFCSQIFPELIEWLFAGFSRQNLTDFLLQRDIRIRYNSLLLNRTHQQIFSYSISYSSQLYLQKSHDYLYVLCMYKYTKKTSSVHIYCSSLPPPFGNAACTSGRSRVLTVFRSTCAALIRCLVRQARSTI
jgi:hypothetical protein